MKAPDKVYCESCSDGIYSHIHRWENADNIEYIRKDALLEWAKKKNKRIDTEDGDYSLGYVSAMIDLIDKIESL